MVVLFVIYGFAALTLCICLYAARKDIQTLTIHNGTNVSIAILFIAAWLLNKLALHFGMIDASLFNSLATHLISAGLMLAVCFILFILGVMGGGDAKMLPALALWLPLSAIPGFIMTMSLIGGILGITALILKGKSWLKPTNEQGWIAALAHGESTVPYGVALAAGACYAFINQGYLGGLS